MLGHGWIVTALDQPVLLVLLLAIICGVILVAAIAIVRHADILAHRLGEPAGTLLLTLAITGLEVAMVAFVMSTGSDKPTLARDTMFAVVMLVLNGFWGWPAARRPAPPRATLQSAKCERVSGDDPAAHRAGPHPAGLHAGDERRPTLSKFQMMFLSADVGGHLRQFSCLSRTGGIAVFHRPRRRQAAAPELEHPFPRIRHFIMRDAGSYGLPLVLLAKQMAAPLDAIVLQAGRAARARRVHHGAAAC